MSRKLIVFSSSTFTTNPPSMAETYCQKFGAEIVRINIEENPLLAEKCGVFSVPSFAVLEDNHLVRRKLGRLSNSELEDFVGA